MTLESNVFRIANAILLSSKYRLYRIKGLDNAPDEHYQNRQAIIRKLSFSLKAPVTVISRNGDPLLVITSKRESAPHQSVSYQNSGHVRAI